MKSINFPQAIATAIITILLGYLVFKIAYEIKMNNVNVWEMFKAEFNIPAEGTEGPAPAAPPEVPAEGTEGPAPEGPPAHD